MNRRILAATAVVAAPLDRAPPRGRLRPPARDRGKAAPGRHQVDEARQDGQAPGPREPGAPDLVSASGNQRVLVRLKAAPGLDACQPGSRGRGGPGRPDQRAAEGVHRGVKRLDRKAKVLGQTQRATNIVALQVDASQLEALARAPNVVSVHPVVNYQKALSETVPYIGATKVQAKGFTGQGVRVGILDSGIDYTHVEFGGAGTAGAYEAAYGTSPDDPRNTTLDGLFPTSRVMGGFDFVGESWPGDDGIEDPDPDPIDLEGHGTHVADIVGGTHGVAPKVSLYALKVCSAVDTACSGVGLIRAMDWAVDPNGDGSSSDHLDIVNMSLGSDYGESFDDDLSLAVDTASKPGRADGRGGRQRRRTPRTSPARRPTPRPPCPSRRPRSRARPPSRSWSAPRRHRRHLPEYRGPRLVRVHHGLRRRRRRTSGRAARPTPSSPAARRTRISRIRPARSRSSTAAPAPSASRSSAPPRRAPRP